MKSQESEILSHLQRRESRLTARDAYHRFGVMRLSARILALKKRGHNIATTIKRNGSKHWAEYSLIKN